ncbi:hypothetical protein ACIRBX_35335 [Kitasatospora sp. NPDC096147]|uniref:hypothetical protein n=1 Tax=Kitasatospora sp. NPDC096147 TaxID=3364093 RepID=UPI00382FDF65
MDRVVDLDEVAAEVAGRVAGWRAAGLTVGPLTWRDHVLRWPQVLETDRARVDDPDAAGVVLRAGTEAELSVVMFRGGWADVDHFDGLDACRALPASGIASAADFGSRLDGWVSLLLGGPAVRPEA